LGNAGPEFKTHFGVDPQFGPSPSPNQVALTGGEQSTYVRGNWRAELNFSGIAQAWITPDPQRYTGRVQDYVGQVTYKHSGWGVGGRFGLIAPQMYSDAQFITTATPRQAVEPTVTTPAGSFRYYANTNDLNSGGGDGSNFHQLIRGAGYEAPIPTNWGSLRLMWMNSRDTGAIVPSNSTPVPTAISTPGVGDSYGGLIKLQLPAHLQLVSEYAVSYSNANMYPDPVNGPQTCTLDPTLLSSTIAACSPSPAGKRVFGRAWRTGIDGTWKKAKLSVAYRDVTPEYFNPANPSISPYSTPNRRGLDASIGEDSKIGYVDVGYQFIQSDVSASNRPSLAMHKVNWGWRKKLTGTTQLSLRGHTALTNSGTLPTSMQSVDRPTLALQRITADQRDVGFIASVLENFRPISLSLGFSRDWYRDSLVFGQNAIVTGTQLALNCRRVSFFQLQSHFSANWAARDKATAGDLRILSAYVLPTFHVQPTPLSISPLVSITTTNGHLGDGTTTTDLRSSQLGGRLTWALPAALRHAKLSFEGSRVEMRNNLQLSVPAFNVIDRRLAVLLTFAQDQTQGRL
jgi:hypothetical protein